MILREGDLVLDLGGTTVSGSEANVRAWFPLGGFLKLSGIRADSHNMFGTFITPRMHFRYKMNDHLTFRANAGKGYRTANIITENNYLLASHRELKWEDKNMHAGCQITTQHAKYVILK